ncbi:MAG: hypothetical protein M1812_005342 [Candelaria pacifica]|nr:MAG: hypothetical protein M1812_005342 [Candelaria pacifica]
MSHRETAPYAPQDVQEVAALIRGLESHTKKHSKSGFSCKKTTFPVVSFQNLCVDSWRFQDWDYKRDNLPTYARGLFTYRTPQGKPEIAVRGYDKFFNVDEVKKTKWQNVETNTRGPYELSCKENGCIIFISGLEDGTLLVCSKHSTGERNDATASHAVAGERWVDRHIATVGKTRQDLAKELRRMNATAVAELCDDTFEEHVLPYSPDIAGLYLHGINLNLPEFATYPGHLVQQFAEQWGFKKTEYVMEDDINKVKKFLDEVAETGHWNGRDTEGFVIRCQAREGEGNSWHDWFFKYKFEEPYLMYRQWRELTKRIISGKNPQYKKHKEITEKYLLYARRQLVKDRDLGKAYNLNHGIIAMRNGFLKELGTTGAEVIRQELQGDEVSAPVIFKNVVLVPIASIGCGKTTIAIALVKLFGWAHVQNDDIQGSKGRPQRFASEVCSSLDVHSAVIADRNNHQKREREQIIRDVSRLVPTSHFVALQYVHERSNYDEIRKVTRDRVLARGDNHQTIQAGSKSQGEVIGIMEGFLKRFEPVNNRSEPDKMFNTVIDMDITASSRENLETVISRLHSEYPKLIKDMPTASDMDEAIDAALRDYQIQMESKHSLSFNKNKGGSKPPTNYTGEAHYTPQQSGSRQSSKPAKIDYFGVRLPSSQLLASLDKVFVSKTPESARLYRHLQQSRRIQPAFHVTLIHQSAAKDRPELWQRLNDLHDKTVISLQQAAKDSNTTVPFSPELGKCRIELERVVWDDRVMCVVARLLDAQEHGFETVNEVAHITIGTANQNIKPKESNDLLSRWLAMGSSEESGIGEAQIPGKVVLYGTVQAMGQNR